MTEAQIRAQSIEAAAGAGAAVRRAAPVANGTPTATGAEASSAVTTPGGKTSGRASRSGKVALRTEPGPRRAASPVAAAGEAASVAASVATGKEEGPRMSSKTVARLRRLLEEDRATYLRQAEELAAEAEALASEREPGDVQFDEESGEGDPMTIERERDLALSASARHAVEEIDRALARMESGDYGLCERCSKRIPLARLEALPHAALCVECKSREERRR